MKTLDILTIVGFVLVVVVFLGALLIEHSSPREMWDVAGFLMAFGGASAGLIAQFTKDDLKNVFKILKKVFVAEIIDMNRLIQDMVRYATIARKEGIMAIERETSTVEDPFLRRALQLAVDGTSPDLIDQMLTTELHNIEERHNNGKAIFDTMATFCPAFGMLGTILGLVLVLKNLDDPKSLGPKMAVALLTTFYGVLGCYAIFTPIAKKLEKRHKEEALAKKLIIRGIMSIQAGDGPRIVESKLQVFLRQEAK